MKRSQVFAALCAISFLAWPGLTQATISVTINSNGGWCFSPAAGVGELAFGSVIRVGQFDLSNVGNYALLQTSNDFSTLDTLFTPLAEGLPDAGIVSQFGAPGDQIIINDQFQPGHVFGQITGIDANYFATGSSLFVWVFNSSTPSSASEWGIFTASSGWDVPADLGSTTLSTFEPVVVVRGDTTGDRFNLSPVPEPNSLMLVSLGALVLMRRARRIFSIV
jgi:hypothetical protein